ncbi:hypothetical protein [Sinorhizobium fredii]|uniref:hypothetical protein n=1 Tax=Rhizobium fredii TaxID=380 RepID=UPI00055CE128|nr:hypothetical protein [Sinorhizobium fredii]
MSEEDRNPREQDEMSANIVTIPKDGELRRFFERLRAAGTLTVNDGDREFLVRISQSKISSEARDFLTRGGPISE